MTGGVASYVLRIRTRKPVSYRYRSAANRDPGRIALTSMTGLDLLIYAMQGMAEPSIVSARVRVPGAFRGDAAAAGHTKWDSKLEAITG